MLGVGKGCPPWWRAVARNLDRIALEPVAGELHLLLPRAELRVAEDPRRVRSALLLLRHPAGLRAKSFPHL